MAPKWCFGLDSHKHTQTLASTLTQIPTLFFPPHSLFIIMLTLLVLRGRRQRDSLLFHEGRLISAKSVCAPLLIPHHSRIVWLPGISEISHLPNLLEMWEICERSPPPWGIPHPSCRKLCGESWAKMEKETERGRLYFVPSSWGLQSQSCSNIGRKMPGQARFCCAVIMCHWRRT